MARIFCVTGSKVGVATPINENALLNYCEMGSLMISLMETDTASQDDVKASRKDVKYLPHPATRVTHLVQKTRLTLRKARQSATIGCCAEIERWRRNCAQHISEEV